MMSTKMRMKFKCAMVLVKWGKLMYNFYTKIGLENMANRWFKRSCRIFLKTMDEYFDDIGYTRK